MLSRFTADIQQACQSPTKWVIVTPNKRLAHYLKKAYDQRQSARVWPTLTVLPWSALLTVLCEQLAGLPGLPRLIPPLAARLLWQKVILNTPTEPPLLAPLNAIDSAMSAWRNLHNWRATADDKPYYRWAQRSTAMTPDVQRFAEWAIAYERELARQNLIDAEQLPDLLAQHASELYRPGQAPAFLFAGFIERAPAKDRLIAALQGCGLTVKECAALDAPAGANLETARCVEAASPQAEWQAALSWAWRYTEQYKDREVAIVVPQLGRYLPQLRALIHDVLPDPEQVNISLGAPLAESSLVRTALDITALAVGELATAQAAALLRSPFLPDADTASRIRRSECSRRWRKVGRQKVSLRDCLAALQTCDAGLWQKWSAVAQIATPASASISDWLKWLTALLTASGFPGNIRVDSITHQTLLAWQKALTELAAVDSVAPRLDRSEFLYLIQHQAARTLFQPENTGAPINIMGMLEAISIPFAAVWVCGMTAENFPSRQQPDALLAWHWQEQQQMPGTPAARDAELQVQQNMVKQWQAASSELLFSYAREDADQVNTPAALVQGLTPLSLEDKLLPSRLQQVAACECEKLNDDYAPPVSRVNGVVSENISRATSLIQHQSDCPFKAFALSRLKLDTDQEVEDGLSAIEHGNLLHKTLEVVWHTLQDSANLQTKGKEALLQLVEESFARAVELIHADEHGRWLSQPISVRMAEKDRVCQIVLHWLLYFEQKRSPFRVEHQEERLSLKLSDLNFQIKTDRIDRLADGEVAIIDYKSGNPESLTGWFDERPVGVQLALYALAWAARSDNNHPIAALAYVYLKNKYKIKPAGAQSGSYLPGLSGFGKAVNSFPEALALWEQHFTALAENFLAGDARVLPRKTAVCLRCSLNTFCRVEADNNDEDNSDEDNNDEE